MKPIDHDSRVSVLTARLRRYQLELALSGSIRESARIADRVRRVRQAMQNERIHHSFHRSPAEHAQESKMLLTHRYSDEANATVL